MPLSLLTYKGRLSSDDALYSSIMAKFSDLLSKQKQYLDNFFGAFDVDLGEKLLKIISECTGTVFCAGIGKSALVAKKIAVTMTSTGTRALFLSPTNALHGDIGIVNEEDVFLFFSKSGESDELLNLVPYLRNKGTKLVAVVCKEKNHLSDLCDLSIYLPVERELCPFDLAPTTSASVQMIFGDVLTVALMNQKQFQLDEYQKNHPAGRIGRRMILRVSDLMLTGNSIPFCNPDDKLVDVLVELSNKLCGCLVVVNKDHILQGIFTDGDLRRSLQDYGPKAMDMMIKELMTDSPRTACSDDLAVEAMRLMESNQKSPITVLPVISKEQKVVGLIKMHDILQSGI